MDMDQEQVTPATTWLFTKCYAEVCFVWYDPWNWRVGSQINQSTIDFRNIYPFFKSWPGLPTNQPQFLKIDQGLPGDQFQINQSTTDFRDIYPFFSSWPVLPTNQPPFLKIDRELPVDRFQINQSTTHFQDKYPFFCLEIDICFFWLGNFYKITILILEKRPRNHWLNSPKPTNQPLIFKTYTHFWFGYQYTKSSQSPLLIRNL